VNASIVEGSKHKHQHFAGKALKLTSTNQGDEPVEVMIDDFLFVRSDGNYLDVYFLEEGKMQHSLIRNTLVNAVSILSEYFPPLIRCHRSYIINLDRIENVDGNAQGLIVKLKNCNEKVPVSRKYIEELKSKLK
jgi:DNA-binding LytR/AlgR family response regulator